jgi:hypothetical protein
MAVQRQQSVCGSFKEPQPSSGSHLRASPEHPGGRDVWERHFPARLSPQTGRFSSIRPLLAAPGSFRVKQTMTSEERKELRERVNQTVRQQLGIREKQPSTLRDDVLGALQERGGWKTSLALANEIRRRRTHKESDVVSVLFGLERDGLVESKMKRLRLAWRVVE